VNALDSGREKGHSLNSLKEAKVWRKRKDVPVGIKTETVSHVKSRRKGKGVCSVPSSPEIV